MTAPPTPEPALLPCPFCGAAPEAPRLVSSGDPATYPRDLWRVQCPVNDCGCYRDRWGPAELGATIVVAAWNRRAPAPVPTPSPAALSDDLRAKAISVLYGMTKAAARSSFMEFLEFNGVSPDEWKVIRAHLEATYGGELYV